MTVSEYPIAFAGAEDYAPEIIFPALTRAVEASGFTREMVAGRRVLLKPNLLMKRRPEEATTTHPWWWKRQPVCCLTGAPVK